MLSPTQISFEFFPPKTEAGAANLEKAADILAATNPSYFSVTFGALGSTRSGTMEAVNKVRAKTGVDVAPHISCIGSTQDEIASLLQQYKQDGVKRLVVLRGDIPDDKDTIRGELNYASELVAFIRQRTGDYFHIEVAAYPEFHPEAQTAESDLQNLNRKYQAGANSGITQYFYNPDAYFYLLDDCARLGINMPVVPGIMPIMQYKNLARFSERCGAEVPLWIKKRLQSYGDDLDSIREFGLEVVVKLCERLLAGGAPGLHFYTLNRGETCQEIVKQLNVSGRVAKVGVAATS